ncbi:hypothetical protein ACFY8C_27730 [Streptomyces flavochromogenes]|uniref:Uncharacterized protein n=1 Tax=Streptomyces flavochromogenes TaxID=68199 RepID=A0ABW6XX52_9ACTN
MTPRVHRIDDVDEAAATAFADGVNALLANRTDSDDVDGAPFAVVRSLTPTWRTRFHRRIMRGTLWHLLALVALCVVAGSLGRWDLVLLTVPIGGFAWLGLWSGLYGVIRARRERWLYRHGVMVTATRATMTRGGVRLPGRGRDVPRLPARRGRPHDHRGPPPGGPGGRAGADTAVHAPGEHLRGRRPGLLRQRHDRPPRRVAVDFLLDG